MGTLRHSLVHLYHISEILTLKSKKKKRGNVLLENLKIFSDSKVLVITIKALSFTSISAKVTKKEYQ